MSDFIPSTRSVSLTSLAPVACSAVAWAATEPFLAVVNAVIIPVSSVVGIGGLGNTGFGLVPEPAMPLAIAWARMTISASVLGNRAISACLLNRWSILVFAGHEVGGRCHAANEARQAGDEAK